jgi:hypothetical protein
MSSWKGGGFGMYADMHPVYNKVFVKSKANQAPKDSPVLTIATNELMDKVKIYPHEKYLEELKSEYSKISGIENEDLAVQIWRPVFDPDSLIYKLQLEIQY